MPANDAGGQSAPRRCGGLVGETLTTHSHWWPDRKEEILLALWKFCRVVGGVPGDWLRSARVISDLTQEIVSAREFVDRCLRFLLLLITGKIESNQAPRQIYICPVCFSHITSSRKDKGSPMLSMQGLGSQKMHNITQCKTSHNHLGMSQVHKTSSNHHQLPNNINNHKQSTQSTSTPTTTRPQSSQQTPQTKTSTTKTEYQPYHTTPLTSP